LRMRIILLYLSKKFWSLKKDFSPILFQIRRRETSVLTNALLAQLLPIEWTTHVFLTTYH
jgi:hypothetical protein